MRKSTICYILCALFLIAGCNSSSEQGGDPISTPANDLSDVFMEDEDSSEQGGYQIHKPVSVLAKAFMEDEDIRELFIKVAHVSYDLADKRNASGLTYYPGHYGYWETVEETESFFYRCDGSWFTDDSLKVDEETAAAIRMLRELFPGHKGHYQLDVGVGSKSTEGRLFVEISLLLRHEDFVGEATHSEDLYIEYLIYTPYDLSDLEIYGYKKIDDNWYSRFMPIE